MGEKVQKERLDILVVQAGLAPSRERAQGLIRAGQIIADDTRVDKPGTKVRAEADIRVKGNPCPYVSRGGYKLEGALQEFGVLPSGRVALDVGASTGGFTDVLLRHGAPKVLAVDVGYNQLAYSIRTDPRVVVMEKLNFRNVEEYPECAIIQEAAPDLVVGDVSFISLTLILPSVTKVVSGPADVIFLVKPQFEVGRGEVGKGGIVRSEEARQRALNHIVDFTQNTLLWDVKGTMESPIQGTQGNIEYLMHATIPASS